MNVEQYNHFMNFYFQTNKMFADTGVKYRDMENLDYEEWDYESEGE